MQTFRVKRAKSLWKNIIGLLGSSKAYPILLKTRFGIHTFFMKYPIDVVILDEKNKVKFLKSNLKPWRVYFWNMRHEKVLELPVGTIQKTALQKGHQLKLIRLSG